VDILTLFRDIDDFCLLFEPATTGGRRAPPPQARLTLRDDDTPRPVPRLRLSRPQDFQHPPRRAAIGLTILLVPGGSGGTSVTRECHTVRVAIRQDRFLTPYSDLKHLEESNKKATRRRPRNRRKRQLRFSRRRASMGRPAATAGCVGCDDASAARASLSLSFWPPRMTGESRRRRLCLQSQIEHRSASSTGTRPAYPWP
jgi:hypothetical protein